MCQVNCECVAVTRRGATAELGQRARIRIRIAYGTRIERARDGRSGTCTGLARNSPLVSLGVRPRFAFRTGLSQYKRPQFTRACSRPDGSAFLLRGLHVASWVRKSL